MKKVFKTMAFTLLGLVLSMNLMAAVTAVSASGIESGKSYVIVATYSNNDYLLKPATFAAKGSTAVSFDASNVSANDAWVFTKSGDTWTIKLSTGEGLYFTNDNNGVACAKDKGASFTIVETGPEKTTSYLSASDGTNTRYLALFEDSNWRCYKNTSNGVPTIQLYSISTTPTPPEPVGPAAVGTVLWAETFDGFYANSASKKPSDATNAGTTVFGGATVTYSQDDDGTKGYNETNAGGTAPELLLQKNNKTWTISGIPSGNAVEMSLTFKSNKTTFALTTTSDKLTVTGSEKAWTISVVAGQTAPETFDLTLKNTGSSNARIDDVVLKVTKAAAADDETMVTISPNGGEFVGSQEITLIPTPADANVYYTTNGETPTASSTPYEGPFTITEKCTVKAIAVKEGYTTQTVGSAEFTKITPLTMAELLDKTIENGSTEKEWWVDFTDWVITGVSGSEAYASIQGSLNGIMIYSSGHGFKVGNHLSGVVKIKSKTYSNKPEITNLTSNTDGLEVKNGSNLSPVELTTFDEINQKSQGALISVENIQYLSEYKDFEFNDEDYINLGNKFFDAGELTNGSHYNVTGIVYFTYINNDGYYYYVGPRGEGDIEEIQATKYDISITTPEHGTVSVNADENKAVEGTPITITTNPADGYKDGTITVVANDETPIEVTNKQFEMPAQSVTITVTFVAKEQYTITWNDRGNTDTQTNVIEGEGLALPENPTAPIGWEFVGWTAIEGYSHETDAPAFAKNGDAVTMATTYYAVYAMVDGDAATGWKLSTGAPVADEQVILAAKGGEDYYAMYAASDGAAATATKLVLDANGIVTNEERLYWSVEEGTYSEKTGLALTNDLTKTVSDEEQKEYLHLNASATKLTTSFQNGVFEFTQSGEGYILHGVVNNKYLTFTYTADPETASYDVAGEGGCVLYVFRYVSAQYFKYTTAPAPQVTIHFELGDGEGSIDDVMINKGSDYVVTSSEPTPATGYDFVGWLYNEVTYVAGQTISNVQTDITLTAQYEAKTYAINYDLNGGNWDGEAGVATYTYGEGAILPTNVEKDGNNFAGWYAPDAEDPTIEIGATETGDKSFTAHWIPATSRTITYFGADEHIEFTTKPMSVDGEATDLTIQYTIDNHYKLNGIEVSIGGVELTGEDEVIYDNTELLITPDAEEFADNVTITFDIQPIEFTVQWLVNGTPVKEIEHVLEGTTYGTLTAPEDPADDTFDNCDANKFMGWAVMDWEGTEDKDGFEAVQVTDGYEIKENQTTLYAVFATEGTGGIEVGTVLWAEDFSGFSANDVPATSNDKTVAYGDAALEYTTSATGTKIYNESLAKGDAPEILIAATSGSFGCSNIPTAGATKMNFSFYSNQSSGITVTTTTTGITVGTLSKTGSSAPYIWSCEINNPSKHLTFQLQINKTTSGNSREDNISLTVAEAPVSYTDYITNCVVTTYRVKFDANAPAGETITGELPAVADVDPTIDYTVPAATLTTDRYTQIGWNEDKTATTAQTTVAKMAEGESTTLYAIWKAKDFGISVKTAPTKVDYKTNATFNPEGLVITKTYDGGFSEDVAYAGHESEFSFNPSLETPLSTAITEVTITYAGKTCTQTITVEEAVIPIYYWVANATELQAGDQIILVCGDKNTIAGPMGTGKFLTKVDLEEGAISNGKVTVENAFEITLGGESGAWTLTSTEGIIGAIAAKNLSTSDGVTTWTISFDENGNASITSTTSTYGTIKYNAGDPRFLNYASGQTDIQIYAKRDTRKTLREELANGKMYSFCPAYNLAYVEGAIFYQPDYMDAAYVHFVEAKEIKAGIGYILEGLGGDLKAIQVGEEVTEGIVATEENKDETRGMCGVLGSSYTIPETSYNYALVADNHLQYVGKNNVIPVERAYLDLSIIKQLEPISEQQRPGVRRVAINFGGQAPTNLNGLNGAVKPIKVMKDGQFYIIREAKMYNAQGIEVQ